MQSRGRRRVDGVGRPKFDFHTALNHFSWVLKSPLKQLITVGRMTLPFSVLMVFVTLSGMLARRFLPNVASVRKSPTIFLDRKSSFHILSTSSTPAQPTLFIFFANESHI